MNDMEFAMYLICIITYGVFISIVLMFEIIWIIDYIRNR